MHAAVFCIAASVIGIDIGWEPIGVGREEVEYTIQIPPQLLTTLKDGKDVLSDLPDGLKIARYRITVGTGRLPRDPSLEQLQAAAKAEKTRDRAEEVAEDLPFRRTRAAEPEPPRRRESVAERDPIPRREEAKEPEPETPRDPLLGPESNTDREPPARPEPAERERRQPFSARENGALDKFEWKQPADERTAPERQLPARESTAEEGRGAEGRSHTGHFLDGRLGEATSEKPLEAKSLTGHRPAEADQAGGPRLADPVLDVKTDEFDPPPKVHPPISGARPVAYDDGKSESKGDHRADHKPQPKFTANTSKSPPPASTAHHPTEEKAAPPQSNSALWFGFFLLISLAGNVALSYFALGERNRSRSLLEKLHAVSDSA